MACTGHKGKHDCLQQAKVVYSTDITTTFGKIVAKTMDVLTFLGYKKFRASKVPQMAGKTIKNTDMSNI